MTRGTGRSQRGAALLMAMLLVTLVATLSAASLWLQWRQVEVETADRQRSQLSWLITGAMDWSRLILREDALSVQSGGTDHLGEPWALPVQESRLSTFLSQDQQLREGDPQVFLSGRITDAQSRLNLLSLSEGSQVVPEVLAQWVRLFALLQLPRAELEQLVRQWPLALTEGAQGPLRPQRVEQLVWLGLSEASVARLQPFVTVLPEPTPVNLNTAPLQVLLASLPALDSATAQRFVQRREQRHFATLEEARQALGLAAAQLSERRHALRTQYFEVTGQLRIDQQRQTERALVRRSGPQVSVVWRERSVEQLHDSSLQ
ncbi:type II secretion system minor pseudopilin GspK [Limnohabitans sp.]|jgi:general secretion pathway protein K|uniref:type II secretion system minor pseudopilin GspK n=1 Tax=Limnohabitans sp. TaxID=1907725 RepID=UPI00391930D4